jgi:catechol 2,3-dioxygenase-like lactoylglutathione lyase family enzyme
MSFKHSSTTKWAALCLIAWTAHAADAPVPVNRIGAVKLIIGDVKENQTYFEHMFGMKEVDHYSDKALYDEPIMGFDEGAHLALFQPLAEPPLPKSRYPVVAIYTSEFEAVVKRVADAGFGYREVSVGRPDLRIVVATDPAGNAVEIIRRASAAAK